MTGELDKMWHLQYEKLVEFKQKNGHFLVPFRYEQDRPLGKWVIRQRIIHTKKKMRQDRKELLDKIEFVWKVDVVVKQARRTADRWHSLYESLVEFKQKNDHCIVPQHYKQNRPLGDWVRRQRKFLTSNKMQPDRKALLDEIGFVWEVDTFTALRLSSDNKIWNLQYKKLVRFERRHEHCRVPTEYKEDVYLGAWVSIQRKRYIDDKMRLDRKNLLDELGFVWKAPTLAARHSATTDDVSGFLVFI